MAHKSSTTTAGLSTKASSSALATAPYVTSKTAKRHHGQHELPSQLHLPWDTVEKRSALNTETEKRSKGQVPDLVHVRKPQANPQTPHTCWRSGICHFVAPTARDTWPGILPTSLAHAPEHLSNHPNVLQQRARAGRHLLLATDSGSPAS